MYGGSTEHADCDDYMSQSKRNFGDDILMTEALRRIENVGPLDSEATDFSTRRRPVGEIWLRWFG